MFTEEYVMCQSLEDGKFLSWHIKEEGVMEICTNWTGLEAEVRFGK